LTPRLPIRVVRRAAREISEASEWWQANRPAAPLAVREELERAFELISTQPRVGAQAMNASLRGVRRVHLSRVGYHLYYRITPSTVEVLAFWHTRRGSGAGL
jgi:plasmid stabilization system protein ParE